jgi:pimeloyl-ACP methyl ester carboxylesterase
MPDVAREIALSRGARMFYRLTRATAQPGRRVVVLLHGMASNLTRWSEFLEYTTLKETWDIVRVDLRGHGESFYRGPIGMRYWCEDLAALLKHEGYAQALLMGHSLGAQVAVQFAARYPQLTQGVVLIDPVIHAALRGSALWIRRALPFMWLAIFVLRLGNALGIRRAVIPNRDLRALDERTRTLLLDAGKQEEMIARYTSPWADIEYFGTANYLQEFIEVTNPLPPLDTLSTPTLVLLSKGVTFTDPQRTEVELARLPRGQVAHVEAYHWPLTEKPREVRAAIEQWCAATFG